MSGTSPPLLAKSHGTRATLQEHTDDVEAAVRGLRAIWPSLPLCLDTAARFHDMGKAASGFQAMLQPGGTAWEFRHEVLSAAIFRECFDIQDPLTRKAYLALLTHHKNLGRTDVGEAFTACQSKTKYSRWFGKWGEMPTARLKAEFPSELSGWKYDAQAPSPANSVAGHLKEVLAAFDDLEMTRMRGALVAADHLASAGLPPTLQGRTITRAALESYMEEQARKRGQAWSGWNPMQQKAASADGNTLLVAPTGAGKTEAALLWALKHRSLPTPSGESRSGAERIFYVLPYQVSINAMAERLSQVFPDEEGNTSPEGNGNVSILHSNMDLALFESARRGGASDDEALQAVLQNKDAARKIYAPLKVTTVYQLLNNFFGRKMFEIGLLELSNSLVIFDEIHVYDGHTLGLMLVLLKYLQHLGANVLLMTATLPRALKKPLKEAASIGSVVALPKHAPLRREVRRRLRLWPGCIEDERLVERIRRAVKRKKKVAVVCNTVAKAIQMCELLEDCAPYLIHSRFTLGDRAQREAKARIEAEMEAGRVVIATQVLEVSLDVSFEVMFTELAPADSLLQRFGRVARHGPEPKKKARCVIACGEDGGSQKIYSPELLEATLAWARDNIRTPLDFTASCRWVNAIYPQGLPTDERERMENARDGFEQHVSALKPMLDPPADVDLEMTLFETITVVPGVYEEKWNTLVNAGDYLEARRLLVNVDLRAWFGASKRAQREGYDAQRRYLVKKREQTFALFLYEAEPERGLRLDIPKDESHSNHL